MLNSKWWGNVGFFFIKGRTGFWEDLMFGLVTLLLWLIVGIFATWHTSNHGGIVYWYFLDLGFVWISACKWWGRGLVHSNATYCRVAVLLHSSCLFYDKNLVTVVKIVWISSFLPWLSFWHITLWISLCLFSQLFIIQKGKWRLRRWRWMMLLIRFRGTIRRTDEEILQYFTTISYSKLLWLTELLLLHQLAELLLAMYCFLQVVK